MKFRFLWSSPGALRALTLAVLAATVASTFKLDTDRALAVGTASGTYFATYAGSENATLTGMVKSEGVQGVRMYIEWAELEPTIDYNNAPGLLGTDKLYNYDGRIVNLKNAGIKPILMIGRAPPWAAPRERGPLYADKYDAYVKFIRRLVERWSNPTYNAHHWELWPEPDFGDMVPPGLPANYDVRRAWGDNGADFARMLSMTYPVIKSVDPNATVIIGAMAHDFFRGNGIKSGDNRSSPGFNEGGPFVYHFLDDVIDAGGASYFDWIGFNAYSVLARGWEQNQNYSAFDVAAKAKHIQGRLAAKGVSKPLIVMEAGMPSCCPATGAGFHLYTTPSKGQGEFTPDESIQAAYVSRLYLRGLAVDLKGINWWLIEDFERPDVQQNPDNHRGWFRSPDKSPKPAARVYQLMAQRLNGATFGGSYTPARLVSGEVEAYSFTRPNGSTVIAMFNPYGPTDTSTVEVEAAGYVVYTATGDAVQTQSVGGNRVRLTVGYTPVYLETFGSLGTRGIVPMLPKGSPAS